MALDNQINSNQPDNSSSPSSPDNKPLSSTSHQLGGKVQLRSGTIQAASGGWLKRQPWLWLAGGFLLVLIVATGVILALPGRKVTVEKNYDDTSVFNHLPQIPPKPSNVKQVSGLSGRECLTADRRPIGVMLASDAITRPVSGFASADLVFELPVLVSDVTRFLAVYQCGHPENIGSVRSARHDYLFLAEGVDAIVAHWGGSYHALNRIAAGEFNTINALTNPFNAYFRKNNLPAPYNGFTTYDNLWQALQQLGYRTKTTFKGYDFKDDADFNQRSAGGTLSVAWPGSFRVRYEYDQATNRYQRFWGGVKQVDGGPDKETVAPSVVVIMRATNQYADGPGGYNDVGIEGTGELTVYQDGQVIQGTWQKNELDKTDPIKFLDQQGQEITFTRGQVWIMAVESEIAVTWKETIASPTVTPPAVPSQHLD